MKRRYVPSEMFESWGGEFRPKKYRVKYRGNWVATKTARLDGDWVTYELFDGTEGIAKLYEWHEEGKPIPEKPPCCQLLGDSKPQRTVVIEDDDNILEV